MKLKQEFLAKSKAIGTPQLLVTVVQLPTGALEVIQNTQQLDTKITYLSDAYDDDFKLNNNPNVRIVDFILI